VVRGRRLPRDSGWPVSARPHWDCVWPLSKEPEEIMSGSNPMASKDFNCASGSFERDVSDGREKTTYILNRRARRRPCAHASNSDLKAEKPVCGFWAWFKTGSGTVVQSTLRAVPATVPDPVLNRAGFWPLGAPDSNGDVVAISRGARTVSPQDPQRWPSRVATARPNKRSTGAKP
jgi:hypothetical protein